MRRFPTMTDKVCAFTFFLFLRFYWGFSFFTYFLQTMIKSATTNNVSPSPRLFLLTTKKKRPIFFFFFFSVGLQSAIHKRVYENLQRFSRVEEGYQMLRSCFQFHLGRCFSCEFKAHLIMKKPKRLLPSLFLLFQVLENGNYNK